jgi:hypothetical protein
MYSATFRENRRNAEARTRELLEKWSGGEAVICFATAGHKFLHIGVDFKGQRGFLEIRCGDCKFISGPFRWADSHFELAEQPYDNDPLAYVLRDQRNNFVVHCGVIEAEEMYVDKP